MSRHRSQREGTRKVSVRRAASHKKGEGIPQNAPAETDAGVPGAQKIREQVEIVASKLKQNNFDLHPSARRWLYTEVKKGIGNGTLNTAEDARTASAALLAAAAADTKRVHLSISDLEGGWQNRLSGVGNCPPHKCFFRSVISRQQSISDKLPLFDALL